MCITEYQLVQAVLLTAVVVSAVGEQFLPASQGPASQGPASGPAEQQFRGGPPGPMGSMPISQRQQYPYGPGYDRR